MHDGGKEIIVVDGKFKMCMIDVSKVAEGNNIEIYLQVIVDDEFKTYCHVQYM